MTFEQMLSKKKEKGYSCRMLSELSGVPLSTVQKIFSGVTKNPRHETIDALEAVLWDAVTPYQALRAGYDPSKYAEPLYLHDADAAYAADHPEKTSIPSGGGHTVEEWYELPEDILCELIDGVFYELGTPSISHQRILGELFVQFRNCILDHASDCEVLFAPTGVRLDRDNRTMVIPDLLVFCGHEFLNDRYFDGAPDLVVEILSPSTRKKDMTIKMSKYRNAQAPALPADLLSIQNH